MPQSWLDERLEYMGFEARRFPALQPLDVAWRQQQARRQQAAQQQEREQQAAQQQDLEQQAAAQQEREQQPAGQGHSSDELPRGPQDPAAAASSGASASSTARGGRGRGCTTATFARWAQAPGAELPLLASQWNRGAGGWELGRAGRRLLQEAHAAHEWGGAAEEHARGMIGG